MLWYHAYFIKNMTLLAVCATNAHPSVEKCLYCSKNHVTTCVVKREPTQCLVLDDPNKKHRLHHREHPFFSQPPPQNTVRVES